MWLDRLSGHVTPATPTASTPSSTKRSYSPGARRTSNLAPSAPTQRPGFAPRSSSLSVLSNDSTTSLLSSSRRPNGSGLKQSATAVDVPGPLEVLQSIVGSGIPSQSVELAGNNEAYGDFELDLDFAGLSLHEIVTRDVDQNQEEGRYAAQSLEECMHIFTLVPGAY